jgi:uncharacterized protein
MTPEHRYDDQPGSVQVADHPERSRFEIRADGEILGCAQYRLEDGAIAFLHTKTLRPFRGQGVAGQLIQSSLDSARERHLDVLPYCSFVREWIADHPDYADLVPAGQRRRFGM